MPSTCHSIIFPLRNCYSSRSSVTKMHRPRPFILAVPSARMSPPASNPAPFIPPLPCPGIFAVSTMDLSRLRCALIYRPVFLLNLSLSLTLISSILTLATLVELCFRFSHGGSTNDTERPLFPFTHLFQDSSGISLICRYFIFVGSILFYLQIPSSETAARRHPLKDHGREIRDISRDHRQCQYNAPAEA